MPTLMYFSVSLFDSGKNYKCFIETREDVQFAIPQIGNLKGIYSDNREISSGVQYQIKVVLLGEINIRTPIVLQFTHHMFHKDYRPTIGLNLINHCFSYLGNDVHLQIWDIAAA